VSQRQILENSIGILKTLRGPAKILYAGPLVGMPTIIENVINPTTGAPGASWIPLGLTRGGINVSKNLDITVRDDVDQIIGSYDQDITDRNYVLSTQLAEILQDTTAQAALTAAFGSATTVAATTSQPTQVMRLLDDGANKTPEYRWAAVFPKATNGKVFAFVFRRGAVAGGEKVFRFDKNDPASPPLEIRMFPEIATTIASEDAYGRLFEIE
jgi:hypothetical protein